MLRVENMSFSYRRHRVLRDLNIEIKAGTLTAVLGINGCGKSTLLKTMSGLLPPDQGAVLVADREITTMNGREIARRIGYMPQKTNGVACSVFDAVLLGRKPHITWDATSRDMEITAQTLQTMGLTEYAQRSTLELSGGELQKVVIARALAQEPQILLLDEPISHLDIKNQLETMTILQTVSRSHDLAVVVVLHDIGLALRFADNFILLKDGRLFAAGGREIVTPEAIGQVYHIKAAIHECDGIPVVVPLSTPGASGGRNSRRSQNR